MQNSRDTTSGDLKPPLVFGSGHPDKLGVIRGVETTRALFCQRHFKLTCPSAFLPGILLTATTREQYRQVSRAPPATILGTTQYVFLTPEGKEVRW